MIISGLVKNSLIDYPGLIAAVLFVPGCNYNCFYCHNRSLLDGTHEVQDEQEIMGFLKKRAGQLDGVVITGGEPTLQKGLFSFIRGVKDLGYRTKLDTNGSSPLVIARLLQDGLVDYFAVDYKAPVGRYQEICGSGANARKVLKTIELLLDSGADFEVRTTVIPQLKPADLMAMAQELPPLPRYVLNRYRPPDAYLPADRNRISQKPYTPEEINSLKAMLQKLQPNIVA